MLGCCAAIYWRLVERGHGQMALFVLLELSAFSRPSTLLATRRCDLVKPAKGSSRFWAPLQHPQEESRPSRTQEIRRRLPPGLHRPIWIFTYPHVASAVQLLWKLGWEQGHSINFVAQAPAWTILDNVGRWMLFRKEVLGHRQKARTGTNTADDSQQTTENFLWKSENDAKHAKNRFSKSCWDCDILCAEHDKN